MKDLIERQAAIDALHTWFRDGFDEDKWWNSTHVLAAIEGLPSVQQEHKWETCFECPLSHGCPKIKGCTNEQAIEYASQIPNDCPLSAQPKQDREFIRLKLSIDLDGRGYLSIIYLEFDDNGVGHEFEGYSSYSLDVISDYLKEYFMHCGSAERGDRSEQ